MRAPRITHSLRKRFGLHMPTLVTKQNTEFETGRVGAAHRPGRRLAASRPEQLREKFSRSIFGEDRNHRLRDSSPGGHGQDRQVEGENERCRSEYCPLPGSDHGEEMISTDREYASGRRFVRRRNRMRGRAVRLPDWASRFLTNWKPIWPRQCSVCRRRKVLRSVPDSPRLGCAVRSITTPSKCAADEVRTSTNFSGGIQGGISNGEEIYFRVAFKPTATIAREQKTVTTSREATKLAARGRHDPCVLPRAVPMVEAMAALVLVRSCVAPARISFRRLRPQN